MRGALPLVLVLWLCAAPRWLRAEEDPSSNLQARIDQINVQITSEAELLGQIQGKISEVDGQLKILRAESDKLRGEERLLTKKLDSVTADRQRLEQELRELDAESERIAQLSVRRLRATYMHPPSQAFADLFRQATSSSLSHFGLYLAAVRSFDRRTLDSLAEVRRSREEKKGELAGATTKQERVVQEVKQKRVGLAKQMAAQDPLMKELKAQLADREEVVTHLKAQLLRFETVLAGLTGGVDERESAVGRARIKRAEVAPLAMTPFKGSGLGPPKGKLSPPVEGQLVVPFGKEVATKTGIAGVSKGIELLSPAGASVKVVAGGRVIFAGRMPVLGTILIVDHGERYYSLYGRLGTTTVNRGAEVSAGEVVGALGEPDGEGRNFYFEIRKNGVPVNPQPFLRVKM